MMFKTYKVLRPTQSFKKGETIFLVQKVGKISYFSNEAQEYLISEGAIKNRPDTFWGIEKI